MTHAIETAEKFISAKKDTIKTMANVTGTVEKAGMMTASALKWIVDVVKVNQA